MTRLRWLELSDKLLSATICLLALVPVWRFAQAAGARIGYPYELEWMEGGIVDHVRVVLAGQQLYREPSLEFTPFIYPPLYYYVSAGVSKLVGIGFVAPRLVSVVSIAASFAVLFEWVRRETGDRTAAFVASGLFAATYGESAFFFDVARVDSLFVLTLLGGYALVRFGRTAGASLAAGTFLGLAVLTKQVGAVLVLPALVYAFASSRRRGVFAASAFALVAIGSFAALDVASRGWFRFYVFSVPAQHEVAWSTWWPELEKYLLSHVAPMALSALAVVLGCLRRGPVAVFALHSSWIVLAIVTSMSSILHTGGYPNVLMPAHAALALAAGLSFAFVRRKCRVTGSDRARAACARAFGAAVVAIQIALLWYGPLSTIVPSAQDSEAGKIMLAEVQASRGPTWMISSGYYPYLARGAPITSHALALADVFKARNKKAQRRLRARLVETIRSHRYQTIVLDRAAGFLPGDVVDEIHRHYRLTRRIFQPSDPRLWPKVGASVRPDEIWEPRPTGGDF